MQSIVVHLVYWFNDPIDPRISTNSLVLGVNKNDLEVLVRRVLVDPVRVEHAKIGTSPADPFLSRGFERALVLQLVNALVCWFAWVPLSVYPRPEIQTLNRMWRPWEQGASFRLFELGYGRRHSLAWPYSQGGGLCRDERDEMHGEWHSVAEARAIRIESSVIKAKIHTRRVQFLLILWHESIPPSIAHEVGIAVRLTVSSCGALRGTWEHPSRHRMSMRRREKRWGESGRQWKW